MEIAKQNPRGLTAIREWQENLASRGSAHPGQQRAFLLQAMQNILRRGFFESNAKIYQRFTAQALNNLYSFARDSAVVTGAGCVLDYLSTLFALQSLGSIRYGPYRRSSEAFDDPALIDRDPLCSFFAVQSGQYPWDPDPREGFWQVHTSHASTALFSCLLRYRVPEPILGWMRQKSSEYEAEIRSGYAASPGVSVEHYSGGAEWLLSAGGRYAPPPGPNFPTLRNWSRRGPWVYDVIARPASLFFFPPGKNLAVERDIIHTRTGWDGDQLALRGNFLYAHAPVISGETDSWPFQLPPGECPDSSVTETPEFLFRFCTPSGKGVHLVFSKVRAQPWKWPWQQSFVRGGLEVVPNEMAPDLKGLRERITQNNGEGRKGNSIPYTTVDGKRLWLNTGYAPGKSGILRPTEEHWKGLLRAWQQRDAREIAFVDGRGALRFRNPITGETVRGDFREWWRPLRWIDSVSDRQLGSGK
jgi:hypothetical protein